MSKESMIEIGLKAEGFEDLKGFEGFYKINQKGELWSCWYKKMMKIQTNENGYLFYKLTNGNLQKGFLHRLLGIQYIPNPDNLPEIDHIDRNKLNNSLDNLRWVDKKTQNNNKSSNIENMTAEKQKERITDLKAYKTEWAKNDRRAKGIPERKAKTEEELKEYNNRKKTEQRANRTPEQIEEDNKKRRETRKELSEEQKEQAKERAKKQREKLKSSTPEEIEKLKEYKKLKAREYRNKKNNNIN